MVSIQKRLQSRAGYDGTRIQQIRVLQTNLFAFSKVEKKSKVLRMHIGNPALRPIYGH